MGQRELSGSHDGPGGGASPEALSHFERGLRAAKLGHPDRAAAEFKEAAWLDPDNAEVHFNLGTAHLSLGFFEQAITDFSNAVRVRPEMADAWGNRAVAHAAIGEDDACANDIAEAARRGGNPDGLATVVEYVRSRRKPAK